MSEQPLRKLLEEQDKEKLIEIICGIAESDPQYGASIRLGLEDAEDGLIASARKCIRSSFNQYTRSKMIDGEAVWSAASA